MRRTQLARGLFLAGIGLAFLPGIAHGECKSCSVQPMIYSAPTTGNVVPSSNGGRVFSESSLPNDLRVGDRIHYPNGDVGTVSSIGAASASHSVEQGTDAKKTDETRKAAKKGDEKSGKPEALKDAAGKETGLLVKEGGDKEKDFYLNREMDGNFKIELIDDPSKQNESILVATPTTGENKEPVAVNEKERGIVLSKLKELLKDPETNAKDLKGFGGAKRAEAYLKKWEKVAEIESIAKTASAGGKGAADVAGIVADEKKAIAKFNEDQKKAAEATSLAGEKVDQYLPGVGTTIANFANTVRTMAFKDKPSALAPTITAQEKALKETGEIVAGIAKRFSQGGKELTPTEAEFVVKAAHQAVAVRAEPEVQKSYEDATTAKNKAASELSSAAAELTKRKKQVEAFVPTQNTIAEKLNLYIGDKFVTPMAKVDEDSHLRWTDEWKKKKAAQVKYDEAAKAVNEAEVKIKEIQEAKLAPAKALAAMSKLESDRETKSGVVHSRRQQLEGLGLKLDAETGYLTEDCKGGACGPDSVRISLNNLANVNEFKRVVDKIDSQRKVTLTSPGTGSIQSPAAPISTLSTGPKPTRVDSRQTLPSQKPNLPSASAENAELLKLGLRSGERLVVYGNTTGESFDGESCPACVQVQNLLSQIPQGAYEKKQAIKGEASQLDPFGQSWPILWAVDENGNKRQLVYGNNAVNLLRDRLAKPAAR